METSLFLAKLIGLYGVLMSLLWVLGGAGFQTRMEECLRDSGFLVVSGFLAVMAGLALVVGHNVWEANWRVVITLVGYLSLLKGVTLLVWPDLLVNSSRFFLEARGKIFYAVVAAPLSGWLAWIGFSGG